MASVSLSFPVTLFAASMAYEYDHIKSFYIDELKVLIIRKLECAEDKPHTVIGKSLQILRFRRNSVSSPAL